MTLCAHHHVTWQIFIILNLNGIVAFFRVCQPRKTETSPKILAPFNLVRSSLSQCRRRALILVHTKMFQLPSAITMSIAATRMYRSLSDFVSGTTDMYDITFFSSPALCRFFSSASDNLPKIEGKSSTLKWNRSLPIAFNQIEVTVDTTDEQYPISQTSPNDMCKSTMEQSCDQPDGYKLQQQPGETV